MTKEEGMLNGGSQVPALQEDRDCSMRGALPPDGGPNADSSLRREQEGVLLAGRVSEVWLYCEKCESSFRSDYWCACWDAPGYGFPFDQAEATA